MTLFFFFSVFAACQLATVDNSGPSTANPASNGDKRILWTIPNYRTVPTVTNYTTITPRQKFGIATADSFDRGSVALAALFAGEAKLSASNPSFGDGVASYGRYIAASYDLVTGDYMTEAIYPTRLHQDPRYFRRGTGSGWSRLGYAVG